MNMPPEPQIFQLKNCESPWLAHVIQLWRSNRKTLGFMPEMGFVEYANKGTVLVAVCGETLLGYAMYGISRGWARLIHLSVAPSSTRGGVASKLLKEMKRLTVDLDGIFLSCRNDYGIDGLWRKVGFTHRFTLTGRSRAGHLLSRWAYDHTPNAILIAGNEPRSVGRSRAVIDTNIFLDIIEETRPNHDSAYALRDDQFSDSLELWVTNELATDIRDHPNSLKAFQRFDLAHADQHACERVVDELGSIHRPKNANSISDQRQLANAIVFGADYFITRDIDVINHFGSNAQLGDKYDIQILLPEQALLMQDELLNASKYIRRMVGSSQWTIRPITASDLRSCSEYFSGSNPAASASILYEIIKRSADAVHSKQVFMMRDDAGGLVAMWLYEQQDDMLHVSNVRYRQNKIRYNEAVHRRILMHAMDHASKQVFEIVSLCIRCECASEPSMLSEVGLRLGFEMSEDKKALLRKVVNFIADGIGDQRISPLLDRQLQGTTSRFTYNMERKFWPLKIRGTSLGAVIIPIRPLWFERLFGGQELCIDLPLFIALNDDQVYYRSSKNSLALKVPSRIIWYVTKGNSSQDSMSYQACSYLDSVEVGSAKKIFEKYKRMGAYSWSDVSGLTHGDGQMEIMIVRFSMTEMFKKKIPRKSLGDEILKRHGHEKGLRANLVSPLRISESAFHELYASAMT